MKILIGVDGSDACFNATSLAARLEFQSPEFKLLHVIEPLDGLYTSEIPPSPEVVQSLINDQERQGREALARTADCLKTRGFAAQSVLRQGYAANEILREATASAADMIAVGMGTRSAAASLFFGGVCRKLAIGARESLLIARPEPIPERSLGAVFATDHSAYAERCVDLLREFAPRGISRLTVLSAYPNDLVGAMRQQLPRYHGELGEWVEKSLGERNKAVVSKLSTLPWRLSERVLAGNTHDAIDRAMEESDSQILILCAQGHGFIERVRTGSTSFAQAVSGRHHTLILRLRDA